MIRVFTVKTTNNSHLGYLTNGVDLKQFFIVKYIDNSKKLKFKTKFVGEFTLTSTEGDLIDKIHLLIDSHRGDLIRNTWQELNFRPAEYYRNVYRPILNFYPRTSNLHNERAFSLEQLLSDEKEEQMEGNYWVEIFDPENAIVSFNQVTILVRNLNHILEFIYPKEDNLNNYGNATRNLLILVCTEFENQIKKILEKNGINPINNNYCTKDYVKVKEILYLSEYKISLNNYPFLNDICPYSDWETSNPTQSLVWYHNYNQVKHDREGSFHLSTLQSCIDSICGLLIILASKYGHSGILWNRELNDFFRFSSLPLFSEKESYIPPLENNGWEIKPLII